MSRNWRKPLLIALLTAVIIPLACWRILLRFEQKFLSTGPNGPATPLTIGIPFMRARISSMNRTLDGYLVTAPPACQSRVALLIFHGAGERISDWVNAQRFLRDHCVASVVYDYSGHGDSSRPGTVENLNQDALAAYSWFASQFEDGYRLCVLGHSMGNGPMLQSLRQFRPTPSRVVVANSFPSLRDEVARNSPLRELPRWLAHLMPDIWNNECNISSVRAPILLVQSDGDHSHPIETVQLVFQAAIEPKQIAILHGFGHDALYREPSEEWWSPTLRFVQGETPVKGGQPE